LRAQVDVALSAAAARFVTDLHQGRVAPRELGYDLDVTRPDFDAGSQVLRLAADSDVQHALNALEPQLRHYALLKEALARYRKLAQQQPPITQLLPLPKRSLADGDAYADAPALRRLLATLGDLTGYESTADAGPGIDAGLTRALMHFQRRHGLDADGILGPKTFRALSTPMSLRAEQVALSMERVRWLPALLETPPIVVNVPQFRLFAFRTQQDHARDILQMDVIVGEDFAGRRTPVFAADMRYVVLHPYWDVPWSILQNELLPEIVADPAWIERNLFEIVTGNGDDAIVQDVTPRSIDLLARGTYRLRQKPGPLNSLGQVKFVLPNRHGVYLHDTPARELFSRSRRAFSHGCIRVADPMALLAHVLRTDPSWTRERIDDAMRAGRPVRIPLAAPVRVFIVYGTALVTEAGEDFFFEDIYQQDAKLMQLLGSRRAREIAPGQN
jgi:murein L,D-transpeptidase YcbB/YkuD